jgi:hypothetical protein
MSQSLYKAKGGQSISQGQTIVSPTKSSPQRPTHSAHRSDSALTYSDKGTQTSLCTAWFDSGHMVIVPTVATQLDQPSITFLPPAMHKLDYPVQQGHNLKSLPQDNSNKVTTYRTTIFTGSASLTPPSLSSKGYAGMERIWKHSSERRHESFNNWQYSSIDST